MSRAFVKEDVEIRERSTRRRSASGLPPGALNYITAEGAQRLRARLTKLPGAPAKDDGAISHLESTLALVTIVEPQARPEAVVFGATVTLRTADGTPATYRIVGVEEVDLHPGGVSWVSPLGRALLGAEIGQRVRLDEASKEAATVVKIE
ncbi:MAG: transcription elongation factor GreB [Chthoniobacter sp.]|jgi:endonuclease YncB( thermonuclease family)|nr:transcription elongation factor GreB [Chthoniobacter sp.]